MAVEVGKPNIVVGTIVGLLVALLSSVIWYAVVVVTNYQLGIIAIFVGLLVGLGVLKGAGGRSSRQLQISAVVITILAMGLSEYLIVNHLINKSLEAEGGVDTCLW
jgi:D-alanyl-lipoteichoic acid acyltransferase DltB (MBOAT superfamily)